MQGLKIESLSHWFGATQVLDGINLHIEESEFLAVLGPSGCGKTTLLRALGGFVRPSQGRIIFGDTIYSSPKTCLPVQYRDLGMVFQSFALWPHMTVREHVAFPMASFRHKNKSSKEKRTLVDKTIETVGLTNFQNRLPHQLSGGQKQRVSLARAIVASPSILLMDEPLSALDQDLRVNMRREIQNIHRLTGAIVVYVTHDQGEALSMANRIVIINNGRIEQVGSPQEIYGNPQTPFVATFVSKCNFVRGTWRGDSFVVQGTHGLVYPKKKVGDNFCEKGLYPVRPEQFRFSYGSQGLEAVILNKQYNGREIHYAVSCQNDIFTIYTESSQVYHVGDSLRLVFQNSFLEPGI